MSRWIAGSNGRTFSSRFSFHIDWPKQRPITSTTLDCRAASKTDEGRGVFTFGVYDIRGMRKCGGARAASSEDSAHTGFDREQILLNLEVNLWALELLRHLNKHRSA